MIPLHLAEAGKGRTKRSKARILSYLSRSIRKLSLQAIYSRKIRGWCKLPKKRQLLLNLYVLYRLASVTRCAS